MQENKVNKNQSNTRLVILEASQSCYRTKDNDMKQALSLINRRTVVITDDTLHVIYMRILHNAVQVIFS
jgi:hypothetical protein